MPCRSLQNHAVPTVVARLLFTLPAATRMMHCAAGAWKRSGPPTVQLCRQACWVSGRG